MDRIRIKTGLFILLILILTAQGIGANEEGTLLCGDVNNSGGINVLDITYLINYLYKDGPAPLIPAFADVNNCDGQINVLDITFLINYLYKQGVTPDCCPSADSGLFTIEAKYTYITSYPNGGGLFIAGLVPLENFTGNVYLSLGADTILNAQLNKTVLNASNEIVEIEISPSESAEHQIYEIQLLAFNADTLISTTFEIEVWPSFGEITTEWTESKRDEFVDWLEIEHPEFGDFSEQNWFTYITYMGILVVEHWTFLNENWEFRICFHVMIPPYDWSKMQIRPRDAWSPIFTAERSFDSTSADYIFYEIPISEYPTFYDY